MPNNILITPGSASIQFSGSLVNTIRLQVEPSGAVAFYGTSGSLVSIVDGPNGTLLGVSGSLVVTGSLNATSITSSFISGTLTGTFPYSGLTGLPVGILSSSTQINALSGVSASFATTASAATSITFTPTTASFANTASFGSTTPYTGLTGVPVGIISASTQFTSLTTPFTGSFSGSHTGTFPYASLTGIPVGIVSSSGQVSYTGLSNIPTGILSSSTQINTLTGVSASFANTASAATSLTFIPLTASFATTASAATSLTFTPASASFATTASGLTGGTTNYIPIWTSATQQSSSILFQTGSRVGLGITNPSYSLDVNGAIRARGKLQAYDSVGGTAGLWDHVGAGPGYNLGLFTAYSFDPYVIFRFGNGLNPDSPTSTVDFLQFGAATYLLNGPSRDFRVYSNTFNWHLNGETNPSFRILSDRNIIQTGSITATSFTGSILSTNGVVSSSSQIDVRNTTGIATIATTGSNVFTGIQYFQHKSLIQDANSSFSGSMGYVTAFRVGGSGASNTNDTSAILSFQPNQTYAYGTRQGYAIGIIFTDTSGTGSYPGEGAVRGINFKVRSGNAYAGSEPIVFLNGDVVLPDSFPTTSSVQAAYGFRWNLSSSNANLTNWAIYAQNGRSYFNDNVGIGTTSPQALLHVQGNVSASSYTASLNVNTPVVITGGTTMSLQVGGARTAYQILSPSTNTFTHTINGLVTQTWNAGVASYNIATFRSNQPGTSGINIHGFNNNTYFSTNPLGIIHGQGIGSYDWISSGYPALVAGTSYGGALIFDSTASTVQPKGLTYFDSNNLIPFAIYKNNFVYNSNLSVNVTASSAVLTVSGSSVFTGSVSILGNISASSFTGSVAGTATTASGLTGGTTNYIPLWSSGTQQSSSAIFQNASRIGIGKTNPAQLLDVNADAVFNGVLVGRGSGDQASNTRVGSSALINNTTGTSNTAVGQVALQNNTLGYQNTAIGLLALANNVAGVQNVGVGDNALVSNISGSWNTAVGSSALSQNSSGDRNTGIGRGALSTLTVGTRNTAVGYNALSSNRSGSTNVAFGDNALLFVTSSGNTAIGTDAGYLITSGANNTLLGTYDGNSDGLDLRASSNNITFSDGLGRVRLWYDGPNNAWVFRNNSAERVRITSTGTVGIGTSTPGATLHVQGNVSASSFTGSFAGTTTTASFASTASGLTGGTTNYIPLWSSATAQSSSVIIQSNNNIGIKTTPTYTLDVYNNGASSPPTYLAQFTSQTSTFGSTNQSNAVIRIQGNNGSNSRTVELGIGVPSVYGLHDTGFLNLGGNAMWSVATGVWKWSSNVTASFQGISYKGYEWYNNASDNQDAFTFYQDVTVGSGRTFWVHSAKTSNLTTAVLQVTSAGGANFSVLNNSNVGIGTTSPDANLTVLGQASFNSGSLSNPGVAARGDLNTGMYFPAADTIGFVEGGVEAMRIDSSGNVGIGTSSPTVRLQVSGSDAIINGVRIGLGNNNQYGNVVVGSLNALSVNTSGTNVTAIGSQTLLANTTGYYNTAVGGAALAANTTGNNNTAVGTLALTTNISGSGNTSVGVTSLYVNTQGSNNSAFGIDALRNNTVGSNNTAIGTSTLNQNRSGSLNTAVGYQAMIQNTNGNENFAGGYGALYSNTVGNYNVAIGNNSILSNTSGSNTVAVGAFSLYYNQTGSNNTAIGTNTLYQNTTGSNNTAVGMNALYNNLTGSENIAIGFDAGRLTTAGGVNNNVQRSIYIGNDTRASGSGNTNEIVIGYNAFGNGSNSATYGNSSIVRHIFTTGSVGIGTATPQAVLHVQGNVSASSFTGSLSGTATTASAATSLTFVPTTSSFATTASAATSLTFIPSTASFASTASAATSITFVPVSASYAITSSVAASIVSPNSNGIVYLNTTNQLTTNRLLTFNGTNSLLYSGSAPELRLSAPSGAMWLSVSNTEASIQNTWPTVRLPMTFVLGGTELFRLATGVSNGAIFSTNAIVTASSPIFTVKTSAGSESQIQLRVDGTTTTIDSTWSGSPGNIPMLFAIGATERMRLTSLGRLGIGTSAPGELLHVQGNISASLINSIGVGRGAGSVSTNTAIGLSALASNTTGGSNTAIGLSALAANTMGSNNTALGASSLLSATTALQNTAIGQESLRTATSGSYNTAVGWQSAFSLTTGNENVSLGWQAGYNITTGGYNIAIGSQAGRALTTAIQTTAVGDQSQRLAIGNYNTSVGAFSLVNNASGSNVAIGFYALNASTTGIRNTAIGHEAGYLITTGTKNAIFGSYTGNQDGIDIRTSNNNIVLSDGDGNNRLWYDGPNNTWVFRNNNSERVRITSTGTVGIGTSTPGATLHVQGSISSSTLTTSGDSTVGGSQYITGRLGINSGPSATASLEIRATNPTQSFNLISLRAWNGPDLAYFTGNSSGVVNLLMGDSNGSLVGVDTGYRLGIFGGGTPSKMFGIAVLSSTANKINDAPTIQTFKSNGGATAAGEYSFMLRPNFYDGASYQGAGSLYFIADGNATSSIVPTAFGIATTTTSGTGTERFRITSSGSVGIGTSTPGATLHVQGAISGSAITVTGVATVQSLVETSAQVLKKDIISIESTLPTLSKLEPSRFKWIDTDEPDIGLVAEHVETIFPELVNRDLAGNISGVKYSKLTVLLLKAIQEMSERIEILEQKSIYKSIP